MKKTVIAAVFMGLVCAGFSQEARPASNEDVRRLFEVMDMKNIGLQTFDAMIGQMGSLFPNVPPGFLEAFREKLDFSPLIDACIPIYAKYYSHDEIMQLIEFYQSPIGRKTIELTPAITEESMAISMEWALRLSQQLIEAMREKGYLNS
ncbi:MAG: DUF2059 domain-containing protein [Spirochaetia bacterium]|jgi:hypothetical protein|nr:DUF2059 domain-containing protein [Spirochaetia bacterium]